MVQLEGEPFAAAPHRERGGLARVVINLCLQYGFLPKPARIVSPKTSMLNLVASGQGIAVIPERMTSVSMPGVTFIRLGNPEATSTCALLLPQQPTVLGEALAFLLTGRAGSVRQGGQRDRNLWR